MPRSNDPLMADLPIRDHLPMIADGVARSRVSLLEAPPGSGKTTLLPLYLAKEPWLRGKKILVLQPRRVAARSVATHMAYLLGEEVGQTVGYQVRMERRVSTTTAIEVITEGLLTRRLISDPELSGVGLIIFDEFHERSVYSDTSLVLSHESLESLRPDLKLLVMSATLGDNFSSPIFADAWRYSFSTAPHPLAIEYRAPEPRKSLWDAAAATVVEAARLHDGDILAFLPGRYEIERTSETVRSRLEGFDVIELYGEQPLAEQAKALRPNRSSARRVVISSPIAETSLTIEGVQIVVDTGLHKVSRTDGFGITLLSTERITRDAADQRAGRAARTAPGVCIRLWSEHEQRAMRPQREPEVLRADLLPTALDLAAWGVTDLAAFSWVTAPSQAQLQAAIEGLRDLGAIDQSGRITAHGKVLWSLGTHPALAQMCLAAKASGHEELCALLITLLEERIPRRDSSDLRPLLESRTISLHQRESLKRWLSRIKELPQPTKTVSVAEDAAAGYLLASAFPGRIGRQREPGSERYLLASGEGASLARGDSLRMSEFLVAASLRQGDSELRISAAVPFDPQLLYGALSRLTTKKLESSFDAARGALVTRERLVCGAVTLKEQVRRSATPEEDRAALLAFLASDDGFKSLVFSSIASNIRDRVAWLRSVSPSLPLPDLSDDALKESLESWLFPFLTDPVSMKQVSEERVQQALLALLTHQQQTLLDREAPKHLRLKSGRLRPIEYGKPEGPYVEVVLQDLFGTRASPVIGSARVPLTIALLSPAKRPVQVTKDLASFWKGAYQEVRKELRGRYPKHRWPENPEDDS